MNPPKSAKSSASKQINTNENMAKTPDNIFAALDTRNL
jgi:hypothetical protein